MVKNIIGVVPVFAYFCFCCLCLGVLYVKSLPRCHEAFLPAFSSRSFIVWGVMFKSLINFKLIFVYGGRSGSNSTFMHGDIHFYKHHLLKRPAFPHCALLAPSSKISWPYDVWIYFWVFCILFLWSKCLSLC